MCWFEWEWLPEAQVFACWVSSFWNCLERIVWSDLVGQGVTVVKFDISNNWCHSQCASLPLACGSWCTVWAAPATVSLFCHYGLYAPETVSSIKVFLFQLPWSWCFFTARIRQELSNPFHHRCYPHQNIWESNTPGYNF